MSGLLRSNGSFWGLTITQFLGAFNDNAFRSYIILLALSDRVKEEGRWQRRSILYA